MSEPPTRTRTDADLALLAIAGGGGCISLLYAGGVASALVSGHPVPHGHPLAELAAFAHAGDPSLAWHAPVGPPVVYWAVSAAVALAAAALVRFVWRLFRPAQRSAPGDDPTTIEGLADRRQVERAAGAAQLLAQAATLRPSVTKPVPRDVGLFLGTSRGVECWMGVRDSAVVLGPPGSGKGLTLVTGLPQHVGTVRGKKGF